LYLKAPKDNHHQVVNWRPVTNEERDSPQKGGRRKRYFGMQKRGKGGKKLVLYGITSFVGKDLKRGRGRLRPHFWQRGTKSQVTQLCSFFYPYAGVETLSEVVKRRRGACSREAKTVKAQHGKKSGTGQKGGKIWFDEKHYGPEGWEFLSEGHFGIKRAKKYSVALCQQRRLRGEGKSHKNRQRIGKGGRLITT